MNWADPLFITSSLVGLTFLIAGLISRKYPAKEINDLYGYRTRRSKSSQESWNFAQGYSNDLMLWIGAYNVLFSGIGLFIETGYLGIILAMVFMGLTLWFLFSRTESELKARFGD